MLKWGQLILGLGGEEGFVARYLKGWRCNRIQSDRLIFENCNLNEMRRLLDSVREEADLLVAVEKSNVISKQRGATLGTQ